jgi:hypothetical protein
VLFDLVEDGAGFFVVLAGVVFELCLVAELTESDALADGSSYLFPSNGVVATSAQRSPASMRAGIVANLGEREGCIISLYSRFTHQGQPEPVTLRSQLCSSAPGILI